MIKVLKYSAAFLLVLMVGAILYNYHPDIPVDYPEVGHLPMEEIPERSAQDVRQFLAKEAQKD